MRGEIRQFLITRRAKITPEQAGLRFYGGNRRVPGLRREEVALLAGISIEYYTRLERGNATGVSAEVLDAIARALQLDDIERAHLADLVKTANTARPSRRRSTRQWVRPSVQQVLDSMTGAAAFVRNGRLTLYASVVPGGQHPYAGQFLTYFKLQAGELLVIKNRTPCPACGMTGHRHIVPMYQFDISGRWFAVARLTRELR